MKIMNNEFGVVSGTKIDPDTGNEGPLREYEVQALTDADWKSLPKCVRQHETVGGLLFDSTIVKTRDKSYIKIWE